MDENKYLPVKYRIEFYEDSYYDDPIYSIHLSSPTFSISVGDMVEPRSWNNTNIPENMIYEVQKIIHLLWSIDNSHVVHSLSVVLKRIPRIDQAH